MCSVRPPISIVIITRAHIRHMQRHLTIFYIVPTNNLCGGPGHDHVNLIEFGSSRFCGRCAMMGHIRFSREIFVIDSETENGVCGFWGFTCGGGCGSGCWKQLMTFVNTLQTRQIWPIFVLHPKLFQFFHFFQVKAYIVDPCAMQFQTGIGRRSSDFQIVGANFVWRWHWAAATAVAVVCCIWRHWHFHIWNCLHWIYIYVYIWYVCIYARLTWRYWAPIKNSLVSSCSSSFLFTSSTFMFGISQFEFSFLSLLFSPLPFRKDTSEYYYSLLSVSKPETNSPEWEEPKQKQKPNEKQNKKNKFENNNAGSRIGEIINNNKTKFGSFDWRFIHIILSVPVSLTQSAMWACNLQMISRARDGCLFVFLLFVRSAAPSLSITVIITRHQQK